MSGSVEKFLKDYKIPNYYVQKIELEFELDWSKTIVTSRMQFLQSEECPDHAPLVLVGEEMSLISVHMNNSELKEGIDFIKLPDGLEIKNVGKSFEVTIKNSINPAANKALEGIYQSGNIICSQCEAEGFRRITYYVDRPDNLAIFTTKIIADKKTFPILLSNGNLIEKGELAGGKHFAVWNDPFRKPSYLFALVAGDLGMIHDHFVTRSNRKVRLEIYCDKGNEDKCLFAMESLKQSMKWDEERFDLEYDLDIFMIVAVDSFNAGAMENKGLNIFNSSYVLAKKETATDPDFMGIQAVVGHEYFHNWTGNRVTCRDWFQLTLKEGLTVFRDQEFSSDLNTRSVQRIEDVQGLRNSQFVEDAGPTSHPIKPKSYIEMNNFYTATVYEKGSEVIRMVHTLLGEKGFQKGMKKYFELFDGKAVTTEDFLYAMSAANHNYDFTQFSNWYDVSGTPKLQITTSYDQNSKTFKMHVVQKLSAQAKAVSVNALLMPFKVGLIGNDGSDILEKIVILSKPEETIVFDKINVKPYVSLNRDFSAPVVVDYNYSNEELAFLASNDSNEFCRYEAFQLLQQVEVNSIIASFKNGKKPEVSNVFLQSYASILADRALNGSIKAMMLQLPTTANLFATQTTIDFENSVKALDYLGDLIVKEFGTKILALYHQNQEDSIPQRALKNYCLGILSDFELARKQFNSAKNMTDEMAALRVIADHDSEDAKILLEKFFNKWSHEKLVLQKWFAVQATSKKCATVANIKRLEQNVAYDKTVPNFVRSLLSRFAANVRFFHAQDGAGYEYIKNKILEIDEFNPQMASSLSQSFRYLQKMPTANQGHARRCLEEILAKPKLSPNTFEIVKKILN